MKNNIFKITIFLLFFFLTKTSNADELTLNAVQVEVDRSTNVIYATGEVVVNDQMNNVITSDAAEYDKTNGTLKTIGLTKIKTSENYEIIGKDIIYEDNKKIIYSENPTEIRDIDGNVIKVDMFNYLILKNMFFSTGNIEIQDKRDNQYFFTEIYIDEKKKKIVGSDIRSFFNDNNFKQDKKNEPRFFANSATITNENTVFEKGIFTSCKQRENNKCPPWSIRSEKISHNNAKKTIYYENAVLKIYDFPVFYFPKFFHPDPTVKRQSGFLVPRFTDNSMVGFGTSIPYFWAISKEKDMTITPKFYANENPIIMNEYRHAFKNSFLIVDNSYSPGYKKNTNTKLPGSKSHFFSKFNMNLIESDEYLNDLEINIQRVSNPTYLEVHELTSELVDYNQNILTNNINYEYQDEDNYWGLSATMYENLKKQDRSRYEYILPNLSFERNIVADEKLGLVDIFSNAYIKNVSVNQTTKMWINDFNWKSSPFINFKGVQSEMEGLLKVVNYEADATRFKQEGLNSEISSALAFNASLPLTKTNKKNNKLNFLTPIMSLRVAPGHMRSINDDDLRLTYQNLFSLNKNSRGDIVDKGLSMALGIELSSYDLDENEMPGEEKYSFAIGQLYNAEENKDLPARSTLDQKSSDVVGRGMFKLNENVKLTNEFSVDHNLNEINYNELGANLILGNANFNLKYLEENNHIGTTNYVKSDVKISFNDSNTMNFDFRRNLETESTEFYSLAYNYLNDCLRAGLVFRRKFYEDRDIEHSDSLMFKISLIPLGDAFGPTIK